MEKTTALLVGGQGEGGGRKEGRNSQKGYPN